MNTNKRTQDIESLKSGYVKPVRYFEIVSIFFYISLALWVLFQYGGYIVAHPIESILYIFLAWVIADFTTGILHWIFDTWGQYDWPILGKLFVRPFLEHHISPNEITRHDWIETNGSNLFVGSIILVIALLSNATPSLIIFLLYISFWGAMTNQFHKWSHQTQVPYWVQLLQKSRIILSKENHTKHHQGEFTEHYCITNGFLNSFLDKIAFFRFLEWSIQKIIGKKPRDNELP